MNKHFRFCMILTLSVVSLLSCSDDKEPKMDDNEQVNAVIVLPSSIIDGNCLSTISDVCNIEYNADGTVKKMTLDGNEVKFEYSYGSRAGRTFYPSKITYTYPNYYWEGTDFKYNEDGFVTAYKERSIYDASEPDVVRKSDVTSNVIITYNSDGQVREQLYDMTIIFDEVSTLNARSMYTNQYIDGNLVNITESMKYDNEEWTQNDIVSYAYGKDIENSLNTVIPIMARYRVISQILAYLGYLGNASNHFPTMYYRTAWPESDNPFNESCSMEYIMREDKSLRSIEFLYDSGMSFIQNFNYIKF